MTKQLIYFFIGTTAELIKLTPVINEFRKRNIKFTIIASGQNDIRFEEFAQEIGDAEILYAITPKSKESSMFSFIVWSIRTFFSLLIGMKTIFKKLNKSNSLFIVHGDTISSLMGSLVARVYGLKLVHIESGLRSFHFFEPFPEEISRYLISRMADIHFCPNEWAVNNLTSKHGEKVNTFQNTLIETFWSAMKVKSTHSLLRELTRQNKKYFVLVIHRQEHVLFKKKETAEILQRVLQAVSQDLECVFMVHDLSANFIKVMSAVVPQKITGNIKRISRLPYGDFMHLLEHSEFMITDGGSNQEEMYYMGKPCLLLRNYTERVEGLGENVILSKNNPEVISKFLKHYQDYKRSTVKISKTPSTIITDYLFPHER